MKSKTSEIIEAFFGTLAFLFILLPIFLILIPYYIVSSPNHILIFDIGAFRYFGVGPIALGVAIYFWCSYNFVFFGKGTPIHSMPPKELVVRGLYRFVRNPMYIAGCLVLAGEALLFQSKELLIYFLVTLGGGWHMVAVTSPEEARQAVNTLIDAGADVIKTAVESGYAFDRSAWPLLSPDELSVLVETAHERGKPVTAHVTSARDLAPALDAGVDEIAHMVVDELPDELVQRMVETSTRWVPTLELWQLREGKSI